MAWVQTISEEASTGKLAEVYKKVRERAGSIPNIAKLQSLRPSTLGIGFSLYCQIMDDITSISKRKKVLIATIVSKINGCMY